MKVIARKFGNQPVFEVVRKLTISEVDDVEFVRMSTALPLTSGDVRATFGDEFEFLTDGRNAAGIDYVDTSFRMNGIPQDDIIAIGFRVHAWADPISFVAAGKTTNGRKALFEFGTPAWMALYEMAHTYDFEWNVSQRYQLHKDSLANVMFLKRPSGLKDEPRSIVIKRHVDELNVRLEQQGVTELFEPDSYEVETHPIDAQFTSSLAQSPYVAFQKKALIPRGVPIGIGARVSDIKAQVRMQELLQPIYSEQLVVYHGGHIHLELGIKGCAVFGHDTFRELLAMPDVFDVCDAAETLANYRTSSKTV